MKPDARWGQKRGHKGGRDMLRASVPKGRAEIESSCRCRSRSTNIDK